jgi:hypothetical protein
MRIPQRVGENCQTKTETSKIYGKGRLLNQGLLPIAIIAIFGNVLGMGTIGTVLMYGVIVSVLA